MTSRIPFKRVNWTNTVFLFFITALGFVAAPIYLWKHDLGWPMWVMFTFYIIATGLSITLGYHRLFSHLSFKAKWPVRLSTLIFGSCAFENSAMNWVSDHRRHHKHTDHDDDPYDISKGFFWAHMGWILFKLNPVPPLDNVNDLRRDPLVMWQHKWNHLIAVVAGLIFPTVAGYFLNGWVGALGGFLVVGALRVVCVQQCTFFINSLCHTLGNQPYSTRCSARDSALMAFLTFGEGYHNYHHEFQHDYRNGVKTWNFDPTKWMIWTLSKIGLVSDLRRVPTSKILLAEMKEARRKAEEKMASLQEQGGTACEHALAKAQVLMDQLSKNYNELEAAMAEKIEMSKGKLNQWRRETRAMMADLGKLRPSRV